MKYKYIISSNTNPYKNLAYEQYLLKQVENEFAIIYLWQNNDTIVVGRNQNIYNECLVDEFKQSGGYIARRKSGGGAVYHDLGNLNFSIISKINNLEKCQYQNIIMDCLKSFGINSDFNGRNDILVEGKKVSGNAKYSSGDTICQHGTLLIDTDIERMTHFLTPNINKLERNYVKSVKSRVINLSYISSRISIETMKNAILTTLEASQLTIYENKNELLSYEQIYSGNDWILGGKL